MQFFGLTRKFSKSAVRESATGSVLSVLEVPICVHLFPPHWEQENIVLKFDKLAQAIKLRVSTDLPCAR